MVEPVCIITYVPWFINQLCKVTLGFEAAIKEQIYFQSH